MTGGTIRERREKGPGDRGRLRQEKGRRERQRKWGQQSPQLPCTGILCGRCSSLLGWWLLGDGGGHGVATQLWPSLAKILKIIAL